MPIKHDKDHHSQIYQAIGEVVLSFNDLEHTLRMSIGTISHLRNDIAMVMTAGDTFESLLKTLNAVFRVQESDEIQRDKLDVLIKELKRIQGHRNTLAHGLFMVNYDDQLIRLSKLKGKTLDKEVSSEIVTYEYDEIKKLLEDIQVAIDRLNKFSR